MKKAKELNSTLLLVEDEAVIALNTKSKLEDCGYEVVIASDSEEALIAVKKKKIDLILMDIDLGADCPDGIETAAVILKNYDIPIVFLYSSIDPEKIKRTEKIAAYGYIENNADILILNSSIKTILRLFSKNKSAENRIMQSELNRMRSMLNDVLNTIPVSVFWKDLKSVYLGCNRLFALDSGKKSPEDIVGLTDYDIRTPEQAELNRDDDLGIIESGKSRINYEESFLTVDGELQWISTSKVPLRNSDGEMYGILGMYENITTRKEMEAELILQKNRLSNILYGSNVGTWEWNTQTNENIVNEHWAAIIGYTLEELAAGRGTFWKNYVHPDDLEVAEAMLEKHYAEGRDHFDCEFRMRHKNGEWIWVLSRGKVVSWSDDGKPLLVSGTHLDINERKLARAEIQHQLEEKEIILKEVHHRIKNNFALIGSLLSMQAEKIENEEAEEALQDAIGRVYSMEALYEKLLLAEDYENASIEPYLSDLVEDIINTFPERNKITINKQISDCSIKSKQIFSLGIIVNELLTNVMKYAFTGRENGVINIVLEEYDDQIVLVIHDNGNGLPEDFNSAESDGFGLMLVRILSQQLNGDFNLENSNGTKATVRIKSI